MNETQGNVPTTIAVCVIFLLVDLDVSGFS